MTSRMLVDKAGRIRLLLPGLAEKWVHVTVQAERPKRSLDQLRYWWAVPVKDIADHCGYTPSQMHYALLGECFGYTAGPLGQAVPVKPSSSELSTAEFSQLIEWVLTWAPSELGVSLEPPQAWWERQP
jgi:hypothetical protein